MKQGIHPEYMVATVVCACGNRFETMSTQEELHVEICAVCHPFYTGKQRLVDTAGRVDRFKRKYQQAGVDTKAEEPESDDASAAEGASATEEAAEAEDAEEAAEARESATASAAAADGEDGAEGEEPVAEATSAEDDEADQPEAAAKK